MKKPDFFIVGAPRCGTTAMDSYLKQHPDLFVSATKELHFFGRDLDFKRPTLTEDEYLRHFSEAHTEKRIGESSVWYLYSEGAAMEIKEFCPSARIIIMLRNPVDMLYSLHSKLLYVGDEDIDDFEAALEIEGRRKQGLSIPPRVISPVKCLFYREVVKYTQQVQRYLNIFGKNNVHIIIYDDFKSDVAQAYTGTLGFLGVNLAFQPDFRVIEPNARLRSNNTRIRSGTFRNFLYDPPLGIQWLGKALMPRPVRQAILQNLKLLNTHYEPRPSMERELRRCLQTEFMPEVERLSELLDRDLTYWSKD